MEKNEFIFQNTTLHNEVKMTVEISSFEAPNQQEPANYISLTLRNNTLAKDQPTILSMDKHLNYSISDKSEVNRLIDTLKKLKSKL